MNNLNNDLSHLNENELEELICKYYNKEYRVKDIINEYNLEILPTKLLSFFPPIKHENINCEYCNNNMFSNRPSRSEYQSRYSYEKDKFCLNCGHVSSDRTFGDSCNCNGCQEYQTKKVLLEEQKRIEKEKKKELQLSAFINNAKSNPRLLPDEENILYRLYLSCLCIGSLKDDFKSFNYFIENNSLAPTTEFLKEIISSLFNHKYIIPTNELNNLDNLEFSDEGEKIKYSPLHIQFELNIYLGKDINILDKLFDTSCLELVDKKILLNIWKRIGYYELLQFLYYQVEQYNLNTEYIGDKIKDMIKILLEDFSISEGYAIIYSSIKGVAAYKQKNGISNRHAVNTIYSNLYNYSNKIKTGEWSKHSYKRNFDLPQTIISKHFFDVLIGIGDKGFNLQPRIKYIPIGEVLKNDRISSLEPFSDSITTRGDEFVSYIKKYVTEYYNGENLDSLIVDINNIKDIYEKIQLEVLINKNNSN